MNKAWVETEKEIQGANDIEDIGIDNPYSFSLREAVERGFVILAGRVRAANTVRFVLPDTDAQSLRASRIADGVILRDFVVIGDGVEVGEFSIVGHHCVIRSRTKIGRECVISHGVAVERDTIIGNNVRISSRTHITGQTQIEDFVQIGANVATVNDNDLCWPDHNQLLGPIFRRGCRVGSGCTILGGVEIGERALLGAGSVVTKSIPPDVVAFGVPAYVRRELDVQ